MIIERDVASVDCEIRLRLTEVLRVGSRLDHHTCCIHGGGEGDRCTTLATSSARSQPDQSHDFTLKRYTFLVTDRILL